MATTPKKTAEKKPTARQARAAKAKLTVKEKAELASIKKTAKLLHDKVAKWEKAHG